MTRRPEVRTKVRDNQPVKKSSTLRKFVIYVLPMLIWMGFIYFMSTDRASAANTRPVVNGILRRLFPTIDQHLTSEQIERIDWNIRKTAHVTEYAILCILAYRAVTFGDPRFRHRNVIVPLLISIGYAATDEYHQSFHPSRDGAAADVFFDSFGGLLGLVLCLWRQSALQSRAMRPQAGKNAIRPTKH
jgi:VanZ family protein